MFAVSTPLALPGRMAVTKPTTARLSARRVGQSVIRPQAMAINTSSGTTAGGDRKSAGPMFYLHDADEAGIERTYLENRTSLIRRHFQDSMGIDDFFARVEMALFQDGFTAENSIAFANVCRDEVCHCLVHKVNGIFGHSFTTTGLGAVLTCGATGLKAGFSHAPTTSDKRDKYVFFTFPHIAIDSEGVVGAIHRPGREGDSSACGALIACLGLAKAGTLKAHEESAHDDMDPELSILRTRLDKSIKAEKANVDKLDLVGMTKIAANMNAADMQKLIDATVDTSKVDYAVISGVQIHNYASEWAFSQLGAPDLEYVYPGSVTTVVKGVKKTVDLTSISSMTPRQIRILANEKAVRIAEADLVDSRTSPLSSQDQWKRTVLKKRTEAPETVPEPYKVAAEKMSANAK